MILRVVIRGGPQRLRHASSFGLSTAIHGSLLAWLVLAAATQREPRAQNIYDQEIRPYEKHIVWYNLREKLPDVKPSSASNDQLPPRARAKFSQSIVAGKKDDSRAPQMIAMPAPAIEMPKPLPLPNMLAVKEASRLRAFVPPAAVPPLSAATPELPEAPRLEAGLKAKPVEVATAKLRPTRAFIPPEEHRPAAAPSAPIVLPEAPKIATSTPLIALPLTAPAAGPRRAFAAPPTSPRPVAPEPTGPAAPEIVPSAPLSATAPRIPRGFTPPPAATQPAPPQAAAAIAPPPLLNATPTPGADTTLAIVGLNPTNSMDIPPPTASHEAGFSAGVKPQPSNTESAANEAAAITVPGLATRGGATVDRPAAAGTLAPMAARQTLMAALHESIPKSVAAPPPGGSLASRVPNAPDGRLAGRYIYTLAIQMPNITSYSGSWTVWFAEHQPEPGAPAGDMRAPVAVRKVDPKYIQAAVEERVEGTVRLAAVIRKTGHVEAVQLLQHLDGRLDRSAEEALAKWEFEPAQRNGNPIDVDAVFEIPFRLAPKPKR
jgi:TonB family protein